MVRVRFAPSPTGSLHLGNALSAVANRRFADEHGGTHAAAHRRHRRRAERRRRRRRRSPPTSSGSASRWDEGPVRQSSRFVRHREAAHQIGAAGRRGRTAVRADDAAPRRRDADLSAGERRRRPRLRDHARHPRLRPSRERRAAVGADPRARRRAAGVHPPRAPARRGRRRSCRSATARRRSPTCARRASRRRRCARTSTSSACRSTTCISTCARLRRLSIDALAALSDEELAARVGVPVSLVPVLRGARDLAEAREYARTCSSRSTSTVDAAETLHRFRELVEAGRRAARAVVRELKAVGGDLKSVRLALTGRERGPELAAVIAALPRDELLRRSARLERCASTTR